MTKTAAKQILEKLDRIETLLVQVIPLKTELTEEDVLAIVREGRREYRAGKLEDFDTFIEEKYPYLLRK